LRSGNSRRWILRVLTALVLAWGFFAAGFIASLHARRTTPNDLRAQSAQSPGDAPPEVRAGVLAALSALQDGYTKRDPKQLDSFMSRLFEKNADIRILGADEPDWARGYTAAAEFIRVDWLLWGDVRLDVPDSVVCSAGDVAWVTSPGEVRFGHWNRPVRFSAVLARSGDHWVFRQLQFRWDEHDPVPGDLFRPGTYLNLMRLAFRKFTTANTH